MYERTPGREAQKSRLSRLYTPLVVNLSRIVHQQDNDTYAAARYIYKSSKKPEGIFNVKFEAADNIVGGSYESKNPDVQSFLYTIKPDGTCTIALFPPATEPWATMVTDLSYVFVSEGKTPTTSPVAQKYVEVLDYAIRNFCMQEQRTYRRKQKK